MAQVDFPPRDRRLSRFKTFVALGRIRVAFAHVAFVPNLYDFNKTDLNRPEGIKTTVATTPDPDSKPARLKEEGKRLQLFTLAQCTVARYILFMVPVATVIIGALWHSIYRSSFYNQVDAPPDQPVLFSHRHHVDELGIDCRYCHTSAEKGPFAGIPSTETCMSCHSRVFADSPMLQPVFDSYQSNAPIRWNRVHDLPDWVYFDHSIHVAKGIGCSTCHGRVDQMALASKAHTLHMKWCLECHRNPTPFVRERSEIYKADWPEPANDKSPWARLSGAQEGKLLPLTDCSVCHR